MSKYRWSFAGGNESTGLMENLAKTRVWGYQLLLASLPRTRTLLTTRRRWRNRVSVRRCASGRANDNYYRDYDPAIGKYTESDPIGLRGGHNTYAYVLNNPLSRIEPRGLQTPALCLNPANAAACAAAGEISEGTAVHEELSARAMRW